jgi:hypothetical protein
MNKKQATKAASKESRAGGQQSTKTGKAKVKSQVEARIAERDKQYALLKAGLDFRIERDAAGAKKLNSLYEAVRWGYVAKVRKLIASGVDVNGLICSESALWGCANEEIVSLLIEAGADVNHQDNGGCSVIQEAAYTGQLLTIIQLLHAGASVNTACPHGKTLVMSAAEYGETGTALALIGLGADLHATDILGKNALMTAAEYGELETVKALLYAGADVLAVDENQVGVLDYVGTELGFDDGRVAEIREIVMAAAAKQMKQKLEATIPAAARSMKTQQRSRL